MPSVPEVLGSLGGLVRLLLILGLLAVVAFYLYQIRDQLARWWNALFGGGVTESVSQQSDGISDLQSAPPRPFSSFNNPIGRESDPRRVVVITFQAFEAWSRERGFARSPDETPSEFALRLRHISTQRHDAQALFSPIGSATNRLSLAYDRIVYGRGPARQADIDSAAKLWGHMTH